TQTRYVARVQEMQNRYDEAVKVLESGAYRRAAILFEGIVRDASNEYRDAATLLVDARNKQKEAALKDYREAADLETQNAWDKAIQLFQRARETDPDLKIDDDLRRLTDKKTTAGQAKCREADEHKLYSRNPSARQNAIKAYEE